MLTITTLLPVSGHSTTTPFTTKEKRMVQTILFTFKKVPTKTQLKKIEKYLKVISLKRFDNFNNDYFRRLYELKFEGTSSFKDRIQDTLLKKLPIESIEPIHNVNALSIKINPAAPRLENDTFLPFQWSLYNSGQKVLKDLDDIHSEVLEGKSGMDMGWKSIRKKLPNLMKRDTIVAVLDSGLDLEHPDLKDNILKSETECNSRGGLPFRPKEDKDNNGLIGDCMGWNYVSSKKGGDNRPYDDIGHGTHVAGIIAATTGNKKGISGFIPKVKILPIKVLQKNEGGRNSGRGPNGSLTDRIAKGILYAIKKDVDVINMSLGWPLILDTNYLKEAVKAAIEKNIIIVAAAGNNNNQSPIFPCSYEGVICVGSMSIDGRISNFSNYGGHVDILAPGDNILSTYPQKLDPDFFSVKGYEIKNGTSQSAPYIAGLAAALKAINPDISSDEVKARIFLSSREIDTTDSVKYVSGGLPNLEKAIYLKSSPIVRPIFKDQPTIKVDPRINEWKLDLKIKNFWKEISDLSIKVYSQQNLIQLEKDFFKIKDLKSGGIKIISLKGFISDLEGDNSLDLKVTIYHKENLIGNFTNNWKISRTLKGDDLQRLQIGGNSDKSPVGRLINGNLIPLVKTVQDPYFQKNYPEYYITKSQKDENKDKGLNVILFKKSGQTFAKVEKSLFLPNATQLLSIIVLDMNYDGKPDYFLRSLAKSGNEKFIQYSYFNQFGNPLFKQYSHHTFVPETVVLDLRKAIFIPNHIEKIGKIAIPLFLAEGRIPKADKNPDPWMTPDLSKNRHFYFFKPSFNAEKNNFEIKTRIMDNYLWDKVIKDKLNLKWNDQINLLFVLPQSQKDLKNGVSKGIISTGKNFETTTHLVNLKGLPIFEGSTLETNSIHLEGHDLFPVTEIRGKANFKSSSLFVGLYNETTIRFTELSGSQSDNPFTLLDSNVYRQSYKRDHIFGALATYKKGQKNYTFFQTKGNLGLHISDRRTGKITVKSRPIHRFSFLPGSLFSETFYPIVKGEKAKTLPALYVDSTQINRSDIYLLTLNGRGDLISPIKYNLSIPQNCRSMNPVPFGKNQTFAFSLFCYEKDGDKESFSMNFLPLK